MKYYLAIDKGSFYKANERYKKLDLTNVNKELSEDNNLKQLSKFTMTFNNINKLKNFLISLNILKQSDRYQDLVILYELKYPRTIDVAYKCDEEYINVLNIRNVVKDKISDPIFLDLFFNYVSSIKPVTPELNLVRAYANNPYDTYKRDEAIRILVDKLCYKKNQNGEKILIHKNVYDIGLFLAKIVNKERNKIVFGDDIPPEETPDDPNKIAEYSEEDQMKLY